MFRGILRPGQGFKTFHIYRRTSGKTDKARPCTANLEPQGELFGIISQASPKEIEQAKQLGTPITHTIVQYGSKVRAKANDVLELPAPTPEMEGEARRFFVQGDPKDPGELGHFLVYSVEERDDLNE